MKLTVFGSILGGLALALSRSILSGSISQNLGISALPVVPTADNELPLTLRVAKAVIPTETPGGLVDALLGARDLDVTPDAKVLITFDADYKARVVVMPSAAATDVVVVDDDAGILATIVRDDATSETSPHTQTIEADGVGQPLMAGITDILAAEKPSRNLSSLINAIVDKAKKLGVDLSNIAFVQTTVADGSMKLYSADAGTLAGKLADVTQGAAEADVTKPSRW